MSNVNTKSIKKAVEEFKNIKKRGNYPIMYFDREEGDAWTNEYVDTVSYTRYNNPAIINLIYSINEEIQDSVELKTSVISKYAEAMMKEYAED